MENSILLYLLVTCQHLAKMKSGTGPTLGVPRATRANLKAICGSSCTLDLGMYRREKCGLADGRILGSDYGGGIETKAVSTLLYPDCWIVCAGIMLSST